MSKEMSQFQKYIFKSRYARWVPDKKRRETWEETVARYITFMAERLPENCREEISKELRDAIYNMEIMPSMRALMTAGKALEMDEIAAYNCSYVAVDDQRAFDEAMYILMCGVGVGFSVERQQVNQLPTVAENFYSEDTTIKVKDSKIGWATALRQLISLLYGGLIPKWDMSSVRPAGAVLKTFGGRASGPEPLDRLFRFTVELFKGAAGRKLTSLECHDLVCMIADIVVCGGVRRSALISLSNLSDDRMRGAKSGQWWIDNPQRMLANNSAVYTEKPGVGVFMKEWLALYESKSGERGIFNRESARKHIARAGRRKHKDIEFGVNPCGEIILRPCGLCNLTEVVARPEDTRITLLEKVRKAVILGTLQSTLTGFRYVRKIWQTNAEEERLLGVSLTGIMDNKLLSGMDDGVGRVIKATDDAGNEVHIRLSKFLDELREYAIAVNKEWAEKLGINQSVAVTCVKPSGTVSRLVNSSPGLHASHGEFLLMAVRDDNKNSTCQFMKSVGVAWEPEVNKPNDMTVFYFPVKSPKGAIIRDTLSAIQQLELYLTYKDHWTEHNPSCTVYVKEGEWLDVAAWVLKHFDQIGGVAFLPHTNHIYKQAPYTQLSEAEYNERVSKMPNIDWEKLAEFESEDFTTSSQEIACSGGQCEVL